MSGLDHYVATARRAAYAAGALLYAEFGSRHQAVFKDEHDIGLEIDRESERLILQILQDTYPEHNIVAEETGWQPRHSDYTWYVDPLDGTNNYHAGIAYFGVSLALRRADALLLGMVYNPVTNQLFSAVQGGGAMCNGKLVSPSKLADPQRAVLSFIKGHRTYDGRELQHCSEKLETWLTPTFRRTLKTWAPALDWCLLAAGGIDALVSFESELEDQLAGTLIAQEAGVEVVSFTGDPYHLSTSRILATNPQLKTPLIALLGDFVG